MASCALETDEGYTVDAVIYEEPSTPWASSGEALYFAAAHDAVKAVLEGNRGYVLVTGPPKSGKTTAVFDVHRGLLAISCRALLEFLPSHATVRACSGWTLSLSAIGIREDKALDLLRMDILTHSPTDRTAPKKWEPPAAPIALKVHRAQGMGTWVDGVSELPLRTVDAVHEAIAKLHCVAASDSCEHFLVSVHVSMRIHDATTAAEPETVRGTITFADLAADRDALESASPGFSIASSCVNVSLSALRRVVRAASSVHPSVMPIRETVLTKILAGAFEDRAVTSVVTILGGHECSADAVRGALRDLHDLQGLFTLPNIDQDERLRERKSLWNHVEVLRSSLHADRIGDLRDRSAALETTCEVDLQRRQDAQHAVHRLQHQLAAADERLQRRDICDAELDERFEIEKQRRETWMSVFQRLIQSRVEEAPEIHADTLRTATDQPAAAEEECATQPATSEAACQCDIDDDELAQQQEEARQYTEAVDRCNRLLGGAKRRRRYLQFVTGAWLQRALRTSNAVDASKEERVHINDAIARAETREKRAKDRLHYLEHVDEKHSDLMNTLNDLCAKTMDAIRDRDEAIRSAQRELQSKQEERDRAAIAVANTAERSSHQEERSLSTEQEPRPSPETVEARKALLDAQRHLAQLVDEEDREATELERLKAEMADVQSQIDRATEQGAQFEETISDRDVIIEKEHTLLQAAAAEASTAQADVVQSSLAVEGVREAAAKVKRYAHRLNAELEDAQMAVRSNGLPDAERSRFPDSGILADVVLLSEKESKASWNDPRVTVALSLGPPASLSTIRGSSRSSSVTARSGSARRR